MSGTALGHLLASLALIALGCSGAPPADSADSPGVPATGGALATGGAPASSGGSGGSVPKEPSTPRSVPTEMGTPGCGLEAAAFCDTFEAPSKVQGRAGELDPAQWSAGRLQPQLPTGSGQTFAIGPATLPSCRNGLPDKVLPSQDALICDPNADIASHHLLVAVAAQNYGINSYRVRQPFDFSGRTGTIVFDAEGYTEQLLGWISLEVTDEPIAVPSYGVIDNDEGGILPKNGFELQFAYTCNTSPPSQVSLSAIHVFEDYADQVIPAAWKSSPPSACISTARGKLNHFEVRVSEHRLEVYASPVSEDGVSFEPATLMLGADVELPLSRGYVHFSVHNHATLKYSPGNQLDAWVARWDNLGFDGPVLRNWREYEVSDSLVTIEGGRVNVGYRVADEASGPSDVLQLKGVDLSDAVSARLALSAWYLRDGGGLEQFVLKYRFNAGVWRQRTFSAQEIQALTKPVVDGEPTGGSQGALGELLDVPLADLVDGDNTLELVTKNVPQNYPPAALNIDLVVETKMIKPSLETIACSMACLALGCGSGNGSEHAATASGGAGAGGKAEHAAAGSGSGGSAPQPASGGSSSGGAAVVSHNGGAPAVSCDEPPVMPEGAPKLTAGTWTNVSPAEVPFGDAFTQGMAIDPCDPATLYLTVCSFDVEGNKAGLYKTNDAGATWRKISQLDEPIRIRIDPQDPNHLYAVDGVRGGTQGFHVSFDGGETFEQPEGFQSLKTSAEMYQYDTYDVAVDPSDFAHVLVSNHSAWGWTDSKWNTNSGVLESTDGGNSWIVHEPLEGWGSGHAISFLYNPELGIGDSNTWLLGTQGPGMFRTEDAGKTWTKVADIGIQHGGGSVYYDKAGNLYASGANGNLRSTDNGLTWTKVSDSKGYNAVFGDGQLLYIAPGFGPTTYFTSPEGEGTTWTPFNTSQEFDSGPFEMALDRTNGILYSANWGDGLLALKLAP